MRGPQACKHEVGVWCSEVAHAHGADTKWQGTPSHRHPQKRQRPHQTAPVGYKLQALFLTAAHTLVARRTADIGERAIGAGHIRGHTKEEYEGGI